MIDTKSARIQLARLKVLPYPVTDELALKELETALLVAENEFHACACISEFTQWADRWPTPADIRRILASTSTRGPAVASKRCGTCQGSGFKNYALLLSEERRGESVYRSRDRMIVLPGPEDYITRYMRTYADLRSKLGPEQSLYEFSEKCSCTAEMAVAS